MKKKDEVKQHQQNGVSRTPRQRYLSSKTTPATAIVGDADLCACDDDVSGFLVPDHLVENVGDLQNDFVVLLFGCRNNNKRKLQLGIASCVVL